VALISDIMSEMAFEPLTDDNCQEVYEFCEQETRFWSVSLEDFKRLMLQDPEFRPELTLVARQDGQLVGFLASAPRKSIIGRKVNIKAIVVVELLRRKGLGTQLLRELITRVKALKFKKIQVMEGPPLYWMPGLDLRHTPALFLFRKNGFHKTLQRQNLIIQLDAINPDAPPESELDNYAYARATPAEKQEVVTYVQKHHGIGFWPAEVAMSFDRDPVTTFIARDKITGALCGWATHSAHFVGSFGPTGVLKSLRGQGIGGILLRWCMYDLKTTFCKDVMTILWVETNTARFYSKAVGAVIFPIFWLMSKRI